MLPFLKKKILLRRPNKSSNQIINGIIDAGINTHPYILTFSKIVNDESNKCFQPVHGYGARKKSRDRLKQMFQASYITLFFFVSKLHYFVFCVEKFMVSL